MEVDVANVMAVPSGYWDISKGTTSLTFLDSMLKLRVSFAAVPSARI